MYVLLCITLHSVFKEGTWQWSDGSKFDYQTWYNGQPNNNGGKEHCIYMNYGGTNIIN